VSQAVANIAAFLAMLAHAEGTDRAPDPYRCCFGYRHTVRALTDHPSATGEWLGERLKPEQCRAAGIASGKCRSTAAGRYQFTLPTWREAKGAEQLPDFSAASQDKAAVWLIAREDALDDVRAGRIEVAIAKCASRWASLPGAVAKQPERSLAELLAFYVNAGGRLAKDR